jgi:ribosomal protein L11 methyltransferase
MTETSTPLATGTVFAWRLHVPGQVTPLAFTPFTEDLADALSDALWGLDGVTSVEVQYKDNAESEPVPACIEVMAETADWDVVAFAPWHACVAPDYHQFVLTGPVPVQPQDWAESWKQYWHVTPVSKRITICPSWESYTPDRADEIVLNLDPGLAFGTGSHETTRLMLEGLDQLAQTMDLAHASILDVGTGSGILAIAAAKLGCQSIMAIDNDPSVIPSATHNATLNHVGQFIQFSATPLDELCMTKHPIILANIIAPVIISLLPAMVDRLTPDGQLHLSGLIEQNLTPIAEALALLGLRIVQQQQQGHWFWLQAQRV